MGWRSPSHEAPTPPRSPGPARRVARGNVGTVFAGTLARAGVYSPHRAELSATNRLLAPRGRLARDDWRVPDAPAHTIRSQRRGSAPLLDRCRRRLRHAERARADHAPRPSTHPLPGLVATRRLAVPLPRRRTLQPHRPRRPQSLASRRPPASRPYSCAWGTRGCVPRASSEKRNFEPPSRGV